MSVVPLAQKSTLAIMQEHFDQDLERFFNPETGQISMIDATLPMELITQIACRIGGSIHKMLDIGCGAGNDAIRLKQ